MTGVRPYGERAAEAAEWLVRLQAEDVSESDALAFDAWLAQPGAAAAYDAALGLDREFAANAAEVRQGLTDRRPGRGLVRRPFVIGGALAAAALALAVVIPALDPTPATQSYATGTGEQRSLSLADGTKIDLNAATRLSVTLDRHERRVVLAEGQAAFDVTHDPGRPFLIAAGDRTVRVVGTQFDVRRRQGLISVTVTRGTVEVLPAGDAPGKAYRLHPGQRFEHQEGAIQAEVSAAAPDQALGWRAGRLVYRGQPLSAVVADLNAQFGKPIRVADPKLAATPVSGVFVLDDENSVVRRLALLVSAEAVPSDRGVVLQRR